MNKTLFILLLLLVLSSCKVQVSFTGIDIPEQAKTVSVSYFQNTASLAGPTVSQNFTESLKDVFISQTRLNLVNSSGDLHYEGSVTGYDIRPVALQGDETAALNRLTITVSVKYVNSFDEKKNFEQNFSRFVDFSSTLDLSSNEESLVSEVNKQLVQDVFDRSLGNW